MPFSPHIFHSLNIFQEVDTVSLNKWRYEYKEKLQMSKKFKAALADIQSSDATTQTIGVESLIGYVSSSNYIYINYY